MYKIEIAPAAQRQLKKIEPTQATRLLKLISKLQANPRPAGHKKLAGHDSIYRIRQGDWRVVYSIEDKKLLVLVVGVGAEDSAG